MKPKLPEDRRALYPRTEQGVEIGQLKAVKVDKAFYSFLINIYQLVQDLGSQASFQSSRDLENLDNPTMAYDLSVQS